MNEPKRRGRPPKMTIASTEQAVAKSEQVAEPMAERMIAMATPAEQIGAMQAEVVNTWASSRAQASRIATFPSHVVNGGRKIEPGESIQFYRDPFDVKLSQAYANRVWSGQSPDVPRHERLERVRKALEGQGLSMEGVTL